MKKEDMIKIAIVAAIVWFFFIRSSSYGQEYPVVPIKRYTAPPVETAPVTAPAPEMAAYKKSYYESAPDMSMNVNLITGSDLIGVPDMIGGSRRNMSTDIRGEAQGIAPIIEDSTIGSGVPTIVIGSSIVQDQLNSSMNITNPFKRM
jgi:hypothetical protein